MGSNLLRGDSIPRAIRMSDQRLSKEILMRQNMHQVLGILQTAKDKVHVASALIVRHQGQLDPKLKVVDLCLGNLKMLQDRIEQEFFNNG